MNWWRDPLITFMLVGICIFAVASWVSQDEISYTIEISERDFKRLNDQWAMQMRRPPSEQELAGLVDQFVKEEIYYREAQRLNLDQNDTIVRRRMVQKLTFLTEDIATATELDDASLRQFYQAHLDNYKLPPRISFRHRYFSSDRRADAETDATAALLDNTLVGDPFMLQSQYAQRSEREIGDLFGREFAGEVSSLAVSSDWQGPIKSAFGWHVVQVSASHPATTEGLEQVREKVIADAQQAARNAANQAYYAEQKARYSISYPVDG